MFLYHQDIKFATFIKNKDRRHPIPTAYMTTVQEQIQEVYASDISGSDESEI